MQPSIAVPISVDPEKPWVLPNRGIVGMWCLITAEAAIFLIFIVAYVYYLGKNLSGPTPSEVLELPILGTICLLSSSLTVHAAVVAIRKGNVRRCALALGITVTLGTIFLLTTASPHLRGRSHHPHQSLRHNLLFTGRFARDTRYRGAASTGGCALVQPERACHTSALGTIGSFVSVLAFR